MINNKVEIKIKRHYIVIFRQDGHSPEIHLANCRDLQKKFYPVQKRFLAKSTEWIKKWMIENYGDGNGDYKIMNCTK